MKKNYMMMKMTRQMMMTYDARVGANKCSNDSIPARGRPAYSDTRTRHNPKHDDDDKHQGSASLAVTSPPATHCLRLMLKVPFSGFQDSDW